MRARFAGVAAKSNAPQATHAQRFAAAAERGALAWRIMFAMASHDPHPVFAAWLAAAREREASDAAAMALATADASGRPSVRMVLLKCADSRGFVFYTNLESPKSCDLRANPRASLCFHWPAIKRQVRIDGVVEPVSEAEADAYFATRPRLSQLGAWASPQSHVAAHRFALQQAVGAAAARFGAGAVPRPPHWSGWRVVPERIEFWRERAFRHHERRVFLRDAAGWRCEWLFP